ncbi:hypothetical protein GUJ93_ZPchr0009g1155 [Zizania palustris]|uniref:Uncharacterized protein n=1 Tax=Zizania palustris TaxID=103762 RepID=A0A8J5RQE1_ZIZPA|nr:hypothetical protein GUJ93_ZPchr0009g1155 [Zizania palustris]
MAFGSAVVSGEDAARAGAWGLGRDGAHLREQACRPALVCGRGEMTEKLAAARRTPVTRGQETAGASK